MTDPIASLADDLLYITQERLRLEHRRSLLAAFPGKNSAQLLAELDERLARLEEHLQRLETELIPHKARRAQTGGGVAGS